MNRRLLLEGAPAFAASAAAAITLLTIVTLLIDKGASPSPIPTPSPSATASPSGVFAEISNYCDRQALSPSDEVKCVTDLMKIVSPPPSPSLQGGSAIEIETRLRNLDVNVGRLEGRQDSLGLILAGLGILLTAAFGFAMLRR